jgi:hypothetical protein
MLYLHCGWPRTSTTSLQTALGGRRQALAAAGIEYPERWVSPAGPTHHGLVELMKGSAESPEALEEFTAFLDSCGERDVLFSAEAITTSLMSSPKREALVRFLAAVREVVPTRCIWTLRRFDDMARSAYLLWTACGIKLAPPVEFFAKISKLDPLFKGIREVEDAVAGDVVYVQYDSSGSHNDNLMQAFGVPGDLRSTLRSDLDSRPRVNVSLTHKQAVALINLAELSKRAGVALDGVAMREAFRYEGFEFEEDRRCELVGADLRAAIHELALTAAERQGFSPYIEFFGDSEVTGSSSVEIDAAEIGAGDLARLTARFA